MLTWKTHLALALIVLAFGVFATAMSTVAFRRGRALQARGVVTEAELTGVAHRESDSDTGHQVYYRFRAGDRWYQRVGVFGTRVGSDVTPASQAAAMASGHLAVRYLPDDPGVNEPVAHARPMGERGKVGLGLGVLVMLAGLVRLGLVWPRRRKDPPAA